MAKELKWFIKKRFLVKDETTRNIAEETKKEAHKFVDRMEELFNSLD